jgi:tRNA-specific 2-thiouridylase
MDYREFLKLEEVPLLEPGPIINTSGEQLGTHSGLASYTIGQRKGIGISAQKPYYVLSKDVAQNSLVVGYYEELGRSTFIVGNLNWIFEEAPNNVENLLVQVRYKAAPSSASIKQISSSEIEVQLHEPRINVTPGQWAVFYDDEICLGGGIILS